MLRLVFWNIFFFFLRFGSEKQIALPEKKPPLTHVAYAWEDYMFKNQLEFLTGLTLLCDFTEKIQFANQYGVRSFIKSQRKIKQHKFQEVFY